MLLLAIILCFGLLTVTANAAETSGTCGDDLTWEFDEATGILTISGSGNMEDYSSAGYQPWYEFSEEITKVVIEEGVTYISNDAFSECYRLASVELPESLTSIGYRAFYACEALKEITIPDSVTDLGRCALQFCKALESVKLPAGINSIEYALFEGCSGLKTVTIPENVTKIDSYAFYRCRALTGVGIPEGVVEIEANAFSECTALTAIEIPDSVTILGSGVFGGCTKLESVKLPANIKKISGDMFSDCSSLSSITIPDSVISLGNSVFSNCSSLTSITIPNSVTSIGNSAFSFCNSLISITIPDSVTRIGNWAFGYCSSLTSITIPDSVISVEDFTFYYCSNLTSITIPDGVTSIGDHAFGNCSSLTSITIPNSVTGIEQYAFFSCSSLTSITIPNSVTSIEYSVFAYCSGLTSFIIPKTVSSIDKFAFSYCGNLSDIYFEGDFPEIAVKSFEKVIANVYYPADNYTWTADCLQNYGGTLTWIPDICKNGHTEVTIPGKEVTCTEAGLTEGKKCSVCGTVTVKQETIPATGVHTYENGKCKDCGVAQPTEPTEPSEPENPDVPSDMDAPVIKSSNKASNGKPKLTWTALEEAVRYEIYRSTTKAGTFEWQATQKGTTYTDTSAKAGKLYYYKVKAIDAEGNVSDFSNRVSRTCDLARPVVKTSSVASSGKIKLTWAKIEGAKSYKVYRATSKTGTYSLMKTVTGTTYTNTSAKAGKTYYYKVIAVHENTNANSAYSAIVSRMCDLARPTITIKRNDAGKPRISWKKVEGAVKYEVWRATSKNGKYTRIATTKNLYQVNKNAVAGRTYYYKVKAIHSNTNANSAFSTVKYIKAK